MLEASLTFWSFLADDDICLVTKVGKWALIFMGPTGSFESYTANLIL